MRFDLPSSIEKWDILPNYIRFCSAPVVNNELLVLVEVNPFSGEFSTRFHVHIADLALCDPIAQPVQMFQFIFAKIQNTILIPLYKLIIAVAKVLAVFFYFAFPIGKRSLVLLLGHLNNLALRVRKHQFLFQNIFIISWTKVHHALKLVFARNHLHNLLLFLFAIIVAHLEQNV